MPQAKYVCLFATDDLQDANRKNRILEKLRAELPRDVSLPQSSLELNIATIPPACSRADVKAALARPAADEGCTDCFFIFTGGTDFSVREGAFAAW
ncbi:MAG TPA: hypothetical protein VMY37_38505 [Thermoguttaceae bacterium]|nr:hypothetical protein [Thermoguttaceae bacterium]